jgi:hypothetical protein
MGFNRTIQPSALTRAELVPVVRSFFALDVTTPADPFGIDDPCPFNPDGHYPLRFHREIVCPHCSKVLWS